MKRWLGVVGVLLVLVWAPFIYRELSAEKPASTGDDPGRDFADEGLPSLDEIDAAVVQAPEPGEAEGVQPEAAEAQPSADEAEEGEGEGEEFAEDEAPEAEGDAPVARPVAAQRAFEQEPRDALWASGAERRFRDFVESIELPAPEAEAEVAEGAEAAEAPADDEAEEGETAEPAAPPAPPEVRSLRCQQTLCRAELGFSTSISSVVASQLHTTYGERLALQAADEEGDQRSIVVFVLRQGYDWPAQ